MILLHGYSCVDAEESATIGRVREGLPEVVLFVIFVQQLQSIITTSLLHDHMDKAVRGVTSLHTSGSDVLIYKSCVDCAWWTNDVTSMMRA